MKYVKRVLTFHPIATKIRNSEEDLANQKQHLAVLQEQQQQQQQPLQQLHDTPAKLIVRNALASIRIFIFGTSLETYTKPQLTTADCFFLLIHLHTNIRFIVLYIDLSLEWGGFLVWMLFSILHILICPCLAFLYTFFGNYGSRSFISLWDTVPIFQGLSLCMFVCEVFKLLETGIIISSGLLSIPLYFKFRTDQKNATIYEIYNCAADVFSFHPGWAVPFRISKEFTDLGYDSKSNTYSNWETNSKRTQYICIGWLIVIVIRIFQYKRYRVFPIRFMPVLLGLLFSILLMCAVIRNKLPVEIVINTEKQNYTELLAYLQVFAFVVFEYLPAHWITIGYLHPKLTMSSHIWSISILKILIAFILLYAIPFFAQDFREYTNVNDDRCLQFFGIHFMFIIIPITIQHTVLKYLDIVVYILYISLVTMSGVCYILISMELLSMACNTKSILVYRFRNLLSILSCFLLLGLSFLFCCDSIHFALFFINFKSHYFSSITLLMLTMIGVSIYGLERINGDHHFLFGSVYGHMKSTKLLFIVMTGVVVICLIDVVLYKYRMNTNDYIYFVIYGICVFPFTFGMINAIARRKTYHGVIQPLTSWGRPQELVRTARRRKNIRQMYIYRTKHECNHSCLLNHLGLAIEVNNELLTRETLLQDDPEFQNMLTYRIWNV